MAAAEDEGVAVVNAELEGVRVADAELTAELELEADLMAAAEDEGADVDVAMPDDELNAEVVAVLLAVAVLAGLPEPDAVDVGAADDDPDSVAIGGVVGDSVPVCVLAGVPEAETVARDEGEGVCVADIEAAAEDVGEPDAENEGSGPPTPCWWATNRATFQDACAVESAHHPRRVQFWVIVGVFHQRVGPGPRAAVRGEPRRVSRDIAELIILWTAAGDDDLALTRIVSVRNTEDT